MKGQSCGASALPDADLEQVSGDVLAGLEFQEGLPNEIVGLREEALDVGNPQATTSSHPRQNNPYLAFDPCSRDGRAQPIGDEHGGCDPNCFATN